MIRTLYAVVDRAGDFVKRRGGTVCVYTTSASAQRCATGDGDTVVALRWDTEQQPLFIRHKVVKP